MFPGPNYDRINGRRYEVLTQFTEVRPVLWAAAAAALVAGIIKTAFGVGAGAFLTPLLSLFVGSKEAVALIAPMMLITDLITLYVFWRRWDTQQVRILIPGCLVGTIIGSYYLSSISPATAKITIGCLAVMFALFQLLGSRFLGPLDQLRFARWQVWSVSFFAGVASSLAHSGGIVVTIYLVSTGLTKEAFVATLVSVLLFMDIAKMVLFGSLHILTIQTATLGLLLTPLLLLGSWLGNRLMHALSKERYAQCVNLLILASGMLLLVRR